MHGNGVIGVLHEGRYKWERRAPLTPAQCARLLAASANGSAAGRAAHGGRAAAGSIRIIVQPSSKRVFADSQYEDVGCEMSDDLSECGLILGVKQPPLGTLLPDRSYTFFSHTHKGQEENLPLLDEILAKRVSLYDYELIVGDDGRRVVAFGEYAGRAGMIDCLRGLGERYLNLGHHTPFLSIASAYMLPESGPPHARAVAQGAQEIFCLLCLSRVIHRKPIHSSSIPLPPPSVRAVAQGAQEIFCLLCLSRVIHRKPIHSSFIPLPPPSVRAVAQGAQEIFRLLPHHFVKPADLPQLLARKPPAHGHGLDPAQKVIYACVVEAKDMVEPIDKAAHPTFDKEHYYAHPDQYRPIFHETIAPYATVIVNCMYWEHRFPRLLSNEQLKALATATDSEGRAVPMRLVGVADITCDVGGSVESLTHSTEIERPFFRYDPIKNTTHDDLEGPGIFFVAVDILPSELPKEATNHFGQALFPFLRHLAFSRTPEDAPAAMQRACITYGGHLCPLFEYIHRIAAARKAEAEAVPSDKKYTTLVSLNGHLFDRFLINDALDVIERAGGTFQLATCLVGQSVDSSSFAEIQVSATSEEQLAGIVNALAEIAQKAEVPENPLDSHTNSPRAVSADALAAMKAAAAAALDKETQAAADAAAAAAAAAATAAGADAGATTGGENGNVDEGVGLGVGVEEGKEVEYKWRVLVLGAGRMVVPVIDTLVRFGDGERWWGEEEVGEGEKRHEALHVTVASMFLEEAVKAVEGFEHTHPMELDISDTAKLDAAVAQADVVISMLPPACHITVANACVKASKHLVTASYVSSQMAQLDEPAKASGVTVLCEMGLDPGIDHMLAMDMKQRIEADGGTITSFVSLCGGLPAPGAADNPLAYKFSWNPRGALLAGRNSAVYKKDGALVDVKGEDLFSSAQTLRLPHFPAFALEVLPNRDSLGYADYYGLSSPDCTVAAAADSAAAAAAVTAETMFRGTLRYEGFSSIMAGLASLGLFNQDPHPLLSVPRAAAAAIQAEADPTAPATTEAPRDDDDAPLPPYPTYASFLHALVTTAGAADPAAAAAAAERLVVEEDVGSADAVPAVLLAVQKRLEELGLGKDAARVVNAVSWLGLAANEDVPDGTSSCFDLLCHRMEERMKFGPSERDMVLLHHELEASFPDGRAKEKHSATLLAFGEMDSGGVSAMARTVGLPAALGAILLLQGKVQQRGVLRPVTSDIYAPSLVALAKLGVHCKEASEKLL
ncbi:unnamed protein product [Closterium sp. Naga37s-1]|nr:unnamed protein product [Closterium sp. Naga37s-1]